MNRLLEIHTQLAETQEELAAEGVSIVTYWFARSNIDQEEYMEVLDTIINSIVSEDGFSDNSSREKLRILVTYGFIFGLVYGREKQENEL